MNRLVKLLFVLVAAITGGGVALAAEILPKGDLKAQGQWLLDNFPTLAATCSQTSTMEAAPKAALLARLEKISNQLATACDAFTGRVT